MVELNQTEMGDVVNRLRRAQGQIGGVLRMIEEGRDCMDIITRSSQPALDRAGFAIVSTGLKQCLTQSDGTESLEIKAMEKLFLSLARPADNCPDVFASGHLFDHTYRQAITPTSSAAATP